MSIFIDFLQKLDLEKVFIAADKQQDNILFVDYCRAHASFPFFENFAKEIIPYHLFIIDNALKEDIDYENTTIIESPYDLYYSEKNKQENAFYYFDKKIEEFSDIIKLHKQHGKIAVYNRTKQSDPYIDINIVKNCIKTAYLYTFLLMKLLNPKIVIIWNMFHPLSQVAMKVADRLQLPVWYAEFGLLPNTICIERDGQMGRSFVARNPEKFNALFISDIDKQNAEYALEHYQRLDTGRHKQKEYGSLGSQVIERAKGRPIIFYAGHNDLASGTYPRTESAQQYHSPIFLDSFDCLNFLKKFAEQNNMFLLYKPHPLWNIDNISRDEDSFMRVENANINECIDISDVTCTVLSQVSYLSLIRKKPVVMLGYTQLRGKNITYEAYTKEEILPAIEKALLDGWTKEKEQLFIEHVARLLKYYLMELPTESASGIKHMPIQDLIKAMGLK